MSDLSDEVLHEGIAVDLMFSDARPEFGDLFTICGYENPNFPPKTTMFAGVGDLGFEQVDDYFGIKSESGDGEDVVVWLFPLVDGEEVYHHHCPYGGVRLRFDVLRNRPSKASSFVDLATRLASHLSVQVRDSRMLRPVESHAVAAQLQDDIRRIQEHWRQSGIECGSSEALAIDW